MKKRLTLRDFIDFSSGGKKIKLSPQDWRRVQESREVLERLADEKMVYGVNTGVGPFLEEKIAPEDQVEFQKNLILSHAAAAGPYLDRQRSRGIMFLLINMLRKGYSGISQETLEFLINLFNRDLIPAIPEQGSVGASGDLVPLAHLAAVLIGGGHILLNDKAIPTKYVFEFETGKIKPIELKPGEAIALLNGTHFMTSILAWAVWQAEILLKVADITAALSFYSLGGNPDVFDERLRRLRPHKGPSETLKIFNLLLGNGDASDTTIQDAYSLRCAPQVNGASRASIDFARRVAECEINSVTGNPIFVDGDVIHGGNFHGQPLSQAADLLGIAMSTLGNISERRIERLLNPNLSGLPAFLSKNPGLDSGLMIAQYTAASLVSENKTLAHPASVDSIPLAAGQEDFVSMGAWACRKAWQICQNTSYVLAIEMLCAVKALALGGFSCDSKIGKICQIVRENIFSSKKERILAEDIEQARDFIWSGEFLEKVAALD